LHVPLQTLAAHVAAMLLLEHTVPHAPQFEVLVARFVSHPSVPPLQSA
jgi:hypothetical protein